MKLSKIGHHISSYPPYYKYGGSINGGTPKLMVKGKSIYKWMMTGGTPMTSETSILMELDGYIHHVYIHINHP